MSIQRTVVAALLLTQVGCAARGLHHAPRHSAPADDAALQPVVASSVDAAGVGAARNEDRGAPLGGGAALDLARFEPREVDLGRVPWFSEVPFQTRFVNTTRSALQIELIKPACGCTILDPERFTLLPLGAGEAVEISGNLKVGAGLGEFARQIDLLLDSGAVHSTWIHYETFATYSLTPATIEFGVVDLDAADELTARAFFMSEFASITAPPQSDSAWLQATLLPRKTAETEIVLRILRDRLPHGESNAQLLIVTDDQFRPVASLPVRLKTRARLRASPARAVLRLGESVTVRAIADSGAISKIASWDQPGSLDVLPSSDGTALIVSPASAPAGSEAVLVLTDSDGNRARCHVVFLDAPSDTRSSE